jgi:hypothetical protein
MTDLARFLHILCAALWMGAALYWPGDLRRALDAGGAAPGVALRRASGALALDGIAGLATILTGGFLASRYGADVVRPLTMWGGLALAVARLALLLLLARPAVQRVAAAASAGDVARARASAKGIAAYAGVAHLLWLLALVAMVFPL